MKKYEIVIESPTGENLKFISSLDNSVKLNQIIETLKPKLKIHYVYSLKNDLLKLYGTTNHEELKKIAWDKDKPIYKFISLREVEKEITCNGCKDGILNQLGHMEQGGCLYDSSNLEDSDN